MKIQIYYRYSDPRGCLFFQTRGMSSHAVQSRSVGRLRASARFCHWWGQRARASYEDRSKQRKVDERREGSQDCCGISRGRERMNEGEVGREARRRDTMEGQGKRREKREERGGDPARSRYDPA